VSGIVKVALGSDPEVHVPKPGKHEKQASKNPTKAWMMIPYASQWMPACTGDEERTFRRP
jgi:hypothetical protein